MNYVSLIGRFTKDPEVRYTQSGKAYCRFNLAVQREFAREEADFINCVAWDKRAETIGEYLKKGKKIAIQGRLNVSSYEQNGETKWSTDVLVEKFEFIDSQTNGEQTNSRYNKSEYKEPTAKNNSILEDDSIDDDDFPF